MSSKSTESNKKRKEVAAAKESEHYDAAAVTLCVTDNAQTTAEKLLSLLPDSNTTATHKEAKKLKRAFRLFETELQHRGQVLAQNATHTGSEQPISVVGLQVPEDVFAKVLDFLSQHDKGWTVPQVCKAWLAVSRLPWEELSFHKRHWAAKKLNMTDFLALLKQPHLNQIKRLKVPSKIKLGKAGVCKLAASCPLIESLDLSNIKPDSAQLIECVQRLPRITDISFTMWNINGEEVGRFADTTGDRLEKLSVEGTWGDRFLHDRVLGIIARKCPKLKEFHYSGRWDHGCTEEGFMDIVRGCTQLRSLSILNVNYLETSFLESLASHSHQLQTLKVECGSTGYADAVLDILDAQIPNLIINNHPYVSRQDDFVPASPPAAPATTGPAPMEDRPVTVLERRQSTLDAFFGLGG